MKLLSRKCPVCGGTKKCTVSVPTSQTDSKGNIIHKTEEKDCYYCNGTGEVQ